MRFTLATRLQKDQASTRRSATRLPCSSKDRAITLNRVSCMDVKAEVPRRAWMGLEPAGQRGAKRAESWESGTRAA